MKKPEDLISGLSQSQKRSMRKLMSDAEAKAVILAIRRGVSTTAIDIALGKAHGTVYTRLGRWAMRRCACFGKPQ